MSSLKREILLQWPLVEIDINKALVHLGPEKVNYLALGEKKKTSSYLAKNRLALNCHFKASFTFSVEGALDHKALDIFNFTKDRSLDDSIDAKRRKQNKENIGNTQYVFVLKQLFAGIY